MIEVTLKFECTTCVHCVYTCSGNWVKCDYGMRKGAKAACPEVCGPCEHWTPMSVTIQSAIADHARLGRVFNFAARSGKGAVTGWRREVGTERG